LNFTQNPTNLPHLTNCKFVFHGIPPCEWTFNIKLYLSEKVNYESKLLPFVTFNGNVYWQQEKDEFNKMFKLDSEEKQYSNGKFQLKGGSIVDADFVRDLFFWSLYIISKIGGFFACFYTSIIRFATRSREITTLCF